MMTGERTGAIPGEKMDEAHSRITVPGAPPEHALLAEWMGTDGFAFWMRVTAFIGDAYPGVFSPEWLFGGKKHGWSLRYRKGKSFCTLVPERGRCALVIVFGGKEREMVEGIRHRLSVRTLADYDRATVYHDGKWLLLVIDSDTVFADILLLLGIKRLPRIVSETGE